LDCFTFYVFVAEISSDLSHQQVDLFSNLFKSMGWLDARPDNCVLFKNATDPASQPSSVVASQPLVMKNAKLSAEANAIAEDLEETSPVSALSSEERKNKIILTGQSMFLQIEYTFIVLV